MINIKINPYYFEEKSYIINLLFIEFLGLEIEIVKENKEFNDYEIVLSNQKKLIIKDTFFAQFQNDVTYLNKESLPSNIKIFKDQNYLSEKDLPIIFGNPVIRSNDKTIFCEVDIFASCFFMLTRWEEYVNLDRDKYSRFPAEASIAYKFNFLDRPIVNEYLEFLWKLLISLGLSEERKVKKYIPYITHDIDILLAYPNIFSLLKNVCADILRRGQFLLAIKKLLLIFNKNKQNELDSLNLYDFIMKISEKNKLTSYFFFMSGGKNRNDHFYSYNKNFLNNLIQEIKNRGHIIGFHPSFDTYDNKVMWNSEIDLLTQTVNAEILYSRQHFLRFNVPETWEIAEANKIIGEFSLGYPETPGFRCGICYDYPVFNFLTKKVLQLRAYPLIFMENSLLGNFITDPDKIYNIVEKYVKIVKQYHGNYVFLWHNHLLKNYLELYPKLISLIASKGVEK
ncbi:MAG: polysaccharide deacetylase family protein [Candidatus Margulisiibacteriota bacterium]|jgi:hypothetical protein